MSWLSRVANAFRGGRLDRELEEELRFHAAARAEDLAREGVPAGDARREARLRLGNALALRERSRDIRMAAWLEALLRDARFGLRMLAKDRVVTLAAVLSLGLAIGACTAAFALVDALILRPLPVRDPQRLVYFTYDYGGPLPSASFSYPMLQRLRQAAGSRVELLAASSQNSWSAGNFGGQTEKVREQFVSGNFFPVLGITPALGRTLVPDDDSPGQPHSAAVLSYSFWMRRFGGSRSVLGRWFQISGKPFQIVGVAHKGFAGIEPGILTDFWMPLTAYDKDAFADWRWQWFRILGRLQPGAEAAQVHGALQAAFTNARRDWAPEAFGPHDSPRRIEQFLTARLYVQPAGRGPSRLRESFERPLWILAAVAALVLLIACSNLANLFTARAMAREREMALRVSIGAGRGRLMQQLLIEGALLAAAACALGLAFGATAAPEVARMLGTSQNPVYLDLRLDWRMGGFAALAGLAAMLLFALVPALRVSATTPLSTLNGGARQSERRLLLRPILAAQIGLSFAVLFVGGLFLVSFAKLANADLGFAPDGVVLLTVGTQNQQDMQAHFAMLNLLDRVRALPFVKAAGVSLCAVFTNCEWSDDVVIPGRAPDKTEAVVLPVSQGFFDALGMRLLKGRALTRRDVDRQSQYVVVNEAFARHFFPGEDPVGKLFYRPESREPSRDYASATRTGFPQRIVGLVRDAEYSSVREKAPPIYYIPLTQTWAASLAVRTAADPLVAVPALRDVVRHFGHGLEVSDVTLQSTLVRDTLVRERLLALLSGFFALVAVVLAAVGLYGVLSYSVVRRTREIGIRVALGARQGAVIKLVVSEIAIMTAIGLAAGFVAGKMLARPVLKLLYNVKPTDIASIALPLACLLGAAAIAAVRPAIRAARVDPAVALREE